MNINIKKQTIVSCLLFFTFNTKTDTNESNEKPTKKLHVVYSHGFGEDGRIRQWVRTLGDSHSAVVYPDSPGRWDVAVLYTKPAVHELANHLYERVEEGHDAIALVGYSCGAGTGLNGLAALLNYDPDYFKGTKITSKAEADKIIAAINNGALVDTGTFLSLDKYKPVSTASTYLSHATLAAGTLAAWSICSSALEGKTSQSNINLASLISASAVYMLFGDQLKKSYSSGIKYEIAPRVTNYNFDPHHPEPINEVEKLRGKITCPILLHFHKNDGVLENPDHDTIKIYDALKGEKTHIIITDDGSHKKQSQQFIDELHKFNEKYFKCKDLDLKYTQPTVDELKKQIYPADKLSLASRNKTKIVIATTVILNSLAAVKKSLLKK